MRRPILMALTLTLVAAGPLVAGTFDRSRIAPNLGVDALNRSVTRERLGRDLFSNPYATVTIGTVDVYDVFPYVETRTFQIVSDPRWNRLVYGESGRTLRAYDGTGHTLGALSQPRGMAVDEANHVYVADTGNDRILVLEASAEFGELDLIPLYEIGGLGGPYDVTYSDGGTPFVPGDDYLYVADTGRNRIVAFALEENGAREISALGALGSGRGRFAGPMAIATGRSGGANTRDVYVADAHTRRLVRLRHDAPGLQWISDARHEADVLTSLEVDHWGNLYAAAPHQGVVRKFNADLLPVAELRSDLASPRSFHVPFTTQRDHRDGRIERVGRPYGLSVDQWSDRNGVALWTLGVEVSNLAVTQADAPEARFTLTDQADVTLEVTDVSSGRSLVRRAIGSLGAGAHSLQLHGEDLGNAAGDLVLRLTATSSYPGGAAHVAQTRFRSNGGGAGALPSHPMLLGNTPNPVTESTRISFVLPDVPGGRVSLRVFDATGRVLRTLKHPFAAGLNAVVWDGTDDRGSTVPAGIYFYRLRVGEAQFTRSMVCVR